MQGCDAFNNVRNDFSVIVDYFEKLSLFAAGVDRLSSFIRRVNIGGWECEVQDPQPPNSFLSSVIALAMRFYRFMGCVGSIFYRRKGSKYGDCDIRNLHLFGKVKMTNICTDVFIYIYTLPAIINTDENFVDWNIHCFLPLTFL